MKDEYTPDLITLLDEDNQEHNFEILDIIEDRDSKYYALLPCFDSKEEMLYDRGDYLILLTNALRICSIKLTFFLPDACMRLK